MPRADELHPSEIRPDDPGTDGLRDSRCRGGGARNRFALQHGGNDLLRHPRRLQFRQVIHLQLEGGTGRLLDLGFDDIVSKPELGHLDDVLIAHGGVGWLLRDANGDGGQSERGTQDDYEKAAK